MTEQELHGLLFFGYVAGLYYGNLAWNELVMAVRRRRKWYRN